MDNSKKLVTLAVLPFMGAAPVYARVADTNYVGVQYAMTTIVNIDLKPSAIICRFGHYMTDTFAIEGRIGIGMSDDTHTDVDGDTITFDVSSMYGVYGVGYLPINEKVSLYGLLGYTNFSIRGDSVINGDSIDLSADDEIGLSFGFGGDFAIGDNASLNVEYVSYIQEDYDTYAASVGVSFGF